MSTKSERERGRGHSSSLNRVGKEGHGSPRSVSSTANCVPEARKGREFRQDEGRSRLEADPKGPCLPGTPTAPQPKRGGPPVLASSLWREIRSPVGTQAPWYPPPAGPLSNPERERPAGAQSCSETQELGLLFWPQDGTQRAHNAQCWNSLFGRKNSCTSGKG